KQFVFYSPTGFSTKLDEVVLGLIRRDTGEVSFYGNHSVNGATVMPYTGQGGSVADSDFIVTNLPAADYIPQGDYIPVSAAMQHGEVYAIYDALVSEYPDYVSRSLLGEDLEGNPI